MNNVWNLFLSILLMAQYTSIHASALSKKPRVIIEDVTGNRYTVESPPHTEKISDLKKSIASAVNINAEDQQLLLSSDKCHEFFDEQDISVLPQETIAVRKKQEITSHSRQEQLHEDISIILSTHLIKDSSVKRDIIQTLEKVIYPIKENRQLSAIIISVSTIPLITESSNNFSVELLPFHPMDPHIKRELIHILTPHIEAPADKQLKTIFITPVYNGRSHSLEEKSSNAACCLPQESGCSAQVLQVAACDEIIPL